MSKNYLRHKQVLGAVVASLFWASAFAQQLPAPVTVDELMIASRAPAPAVSPLPAPSNPISPGVLSGPLPLAPQVLSPPYAPVSGYKRGAFLVATFVSANRAIAEFQVDGSASYFSLGDRLKDGWVIRGITPDSVFMEQCKKLNCKFKTTELEVN